MKPAELAVAFRELAVMFAAGIPLPRALTIEARGAPGLLGQAFLQASQRVSSGKRLSEALAPYRSWLGDLCLELLRVGENSGSLQLVLERLADYLERRHALQHKLRASLTYPAFLFLLSLAMVAALPALLLGGLFRLLGSLGAHPPLLTRVVLAWSAVLAHPLTWVAAVGLGGLAWKGVRWWGQDLDRRRLSEAWLLRLPILGPMLDCARVSLFALALNTLYTAGMPILGGVISAGRASGSPLMARAAERLAERMKDGASLSAAMRAEDQFPRLLIQLVAAGEESGGLDRMLARAALMAQAEFEYRLEVAMAALEPILLLGMGMLVATLVLATVAPMISALESLSS